MTTALGTGLVTFRDVALCDRHAHEVALITDGRRAYVYPVDDRAEVAGETAVARVGVTLTAACPLAVAYDDRCAGDLTWRLDTDTTWGADGDALALLARFGRQVER